MRCYYHSDVEAVGVCSNCGRGICAKSAVEVEGKLSCKGSCEEAVTRSDRTAGWWSQKYGAYITALGIGLPTWGAVAWPNHRLHQFALGAAAVCWGLVNFPLALGAVSLGLGSIAALHPHRHGFAALLFLLGALLVGWGFVRLSRRFKTGASGFTRTG